MGIVAGYGVAVVAQHVVEGDALGLHDVLGGGVAGVAVETGVVDIAAHVAEGGIGVAVVALIAGTGRLVVGGACGQGAEQTVEQSGGLHGFVGLGGGHGAQCHGTVGIEGVGGVGGYGLGVVGQ